MLCVHKQLPALLDGAVIQTINKLEPGREHDKVAAKVAAAAAAFTSCAEARRRAVACGSARKIEHEKDQTEHQFQQVGANTGLNMPSF